MLVNIDPDLAPREFYELVGRCYRESPGDDDLRKLREWLEKQPKLWRGVFDLTYAVREKLMLNFVSQEPVRLGIKRNIDEIKNEMHYECSPMLEKLLIENVINSWLRYHWVEFHLAASAGQSGISINEMEYWEKRLSASQRRYLRACETLARVRKLTRNTPMLQVNIATEKGQQVNIAGSIVKTDKKEK